MAAGRDPMTIYTKTEIKDVGGKPMRVIAALEVMKTVITQTRTGLEGNFVALKVGEVIKNDTTGGGVGGRVNTKFPQPDESEDRPRRPYSTYVDNNDPRQMFPVTKRWGAIHMKSDVLKSGLGVLTFIHEATHKYAGTFDYAYFDESGNSSVQITESNKFDSPKLALWNADSYAWFVVKLASAGGS